MECESDSTKKKPKWGSFSEANLRGRGGEREGEVTPASSDRDEVGFLVTSGL